MMRNDRDNNGIHAAGAGVLEENHEEQPTRIAPRVSDILPGFLEHLRVEEGRVDGTLDRYRGFIERLIRTAGDCLVEKIDGETVALYKRRLMEAGLSPTTIGSMLSCLRSFLRYAHDVLKLTVYDPEKIKRPKIPKRDVEYLTKEEVQRFLAAIPTKAMVGVRDRALVEVLCSTGMRISEALSLDRGAIDREGREARVIGKGNKQRKVYFSAIALEWVSRYLQDRQDTNSALFITSGSEPRRLSVKGSWRRFRRYAHLAGLARAVHPHMLRHTMATTLLANGCPIGHIRVLLGHAQLATTCRYYLGILSDREAKEAHEKFLSYEPQAGEGVNGKSPEELNNQLDR
jgi:integrase/recombinase XerD